MTELKTLKEIDEEGFAYKSNLRQEAIKWIKSNECDHCVEENMIIFGDGEMCEDREGLFAWIRYFFNITEEELK